jgi:hypothetical protein
MTQEKMTINQLEQNLIDELNSNKKEILENQYPEDLVTQLADSYVPIYNVDLLDCLSDDYTLAQVDDTGLLPENPSVHDIVRIAICEKLMNVAHTWLYDNQKQQEVA